MKKLILSLLAGILLLASGFALAAAVKDWHDLEAVHNHVQEAIHEMEHARAANHYDMEGHGAKAEALLRESEKELHMAIEAAKRAK